MGKTEPSSLEIHDPPSDLTLETFLPFTLVATGRVDKESNRALPTGETLSYDLFFGEDTGRKHVVCGQGRARPGRTWGAGSLPASELRPSSAASELRLSAREALPPLSGQRLGGRGGKGGHSPRASGPGLPAEAGRPHGSLAHRGDPGEAPWWL